MRNRGNLVHGAPNVHAGGGAWIGHAVSNPFAVPLSAREPIRRLPGVGLTPAGYVSADGVKVDTSLASEETKSWSGLSMNTVSSPDGVTLSVSFMELGNSAVMRLTHADGAVKELFDSSRVRVEERLDEPLPYRCLNFDLLSADGQRTRLFVPRAVVTDIDSQSFNRSELAACVLTLSCTPDSNGVCLYRLVDRQPQKPTPRDHDGPDFAFVGHVREWVEYITGDGRLANLGAIRASLSTALSIISRISERSLVDTIDQLINRVEHTVADMTDSELLRLIADWAPRDLITGANLDNFRAAFDNAMSWLRRRTKSIAHAVKKIATLWSTVGIGGLIAGLSNGDVQRAIGDFIATIGANWQEWLTAVMDGDVDHIIDNAIASVNVPALGDALANLAESVGLGQWSGPIRAWAGWLGQASAGWGTVVGDWLRSFLNNQSVSDLNQWLGDAFHRWNEIAGDFVNRMASGELLADLARTGGDLYRAAQKLWDSAASIVRENWGAFNPANLVKAYNAFVGAFDAAQYGDIANRFLTDWANPPALSNDWALLSAALAGDFTRGSVAALDALNLAQVWPQLTAAWDQFLQGANAALSELTAQDWLLASIMLLGPLITLAAGFALTIALFVFGQPLFAIPVGLSTLGLVIGMWLVVTQFVGFSLGGALLPWAADLIVISLLTGHPLAALFIFWSVLNGARFIILDFPLLVIAGAAPVTIKAAVLFLASAWVIAHVAALVAVTLLVVVKARVFLRLTQPFRMTGLERAVIAATVAVITFVIVALFSSTVLGLIVLLAARNLTITGRSALINILRAVTIGGVVLPVFAAGVMLSLVRLLRFQLTMIPPVSIALVIVLPLAQALFFHRRITRLLTASELGALGSVLVPLLNFIVSVFGLAVTTVRALIPALFSGTTALITGLAAIPASIAFYASSVTWVLSQIASFTLLRRDIRPVVLVIGSVMALSALAAAAGLVASAPLLAPPLTVIVVGGAVALGVVGAIIACFTAGQLSLFVTGLRGAAQLLLRLVVASTVVSGLFFMSSGVLAGIGPFISALILRGVRVARSAVSVGLIPIVAKMYRLAVPLRWIIDASIAAAGAVVFGLGELGAPLLHWPFRGPTYRFWVPLILGFWLVVWNYLATGYYALWLTYLIALFLSAYGGWVAWLIMGGVTTPASAPQYAWATNFTIAWGLTLVICLVGAALLIPGRWFRYIVTALAIPWLLLDAVGLDTVTTIASALAGLIMALRTAAGVLFTPLRAVLAGIAAASLVAGARLLGWGVVILAADLFTPIAIALGVNHRFLMAAIITLAWIGIQLATLPRFIVAAALSAITGISGAFITGRVLRILAADMAALTGAIPWLRSQKLAQMGVVSLAVIPVVLFVGIPLTMVTRRLTAPVRVLIAIAFTATVATFAVAAATIVPGVGGALTAVVALAIFVTVLAQHPRVLLSPLAGLIALSAGLAVVAAVLFYLSGQPIRAARRVTIALRALITLLGAPIVMWWLLIVAAAGVIIAVASVISTGRVVDVLVSLAVLSVVVSVMGLVVVTLLLTVFNRASGLTIAGIVTVTVLTVVGLIIVFSLIPLYVRIVNTISFPLVGIPMDIFNILTRNSLLGRISRLWVLVHVLAIGTISLGLVALVVVLGIAGTITGFASTAGIATVIVLVYLYVFIPIVAVIIFVAASAAVAYGWWWWVTFGPK